MVWEFMKYVLVISILTTLCLGCKTVKTIDKGISCPNLDKIFPINKSNYRQYMDFDDYDTIIKDLLYQKYPRKIGERIIDSINIVLTETKYQKRSSLILFQGSIDNNLYRQYEIDADTIKFYNDGWIHDNIGFKIGNSYEAIDGFVENEKGYVICWRKALAIGELNLEKIRKHKAYQQTIVQRQEPYLKPLWIFTIKYENGKQKFFTVDGVTGEFRKSSFFDIYSNAVKGVKQKKK